MAEIEAALRKCTISYLSLENDELKGELKEVKEEVLEIKKKLNAGNLDLKKVLNLLKKN
jgi:hypothetical protein